MKVDKFDLKILEALQSNGRMPAARLADHVGLSASPTWERVRKLEEAGVLRGYHADVALERIAPVTLVIVPVVLEYHRGQDLLRFERAIANIPEVIECLAVGGGVDYILRFAIPRIEDYQRLIERLLEADVGIQRYWTYIVTKPIKPFAGVPVAQLVGGAPE